MIPQHTTADDEEFVAAMRALAHIAVLIGLFVYGSLLVKTLVAVVLAAVVLHVATGKVIPQ